MEKIAFGIDAIPTAISREVPRNYGLWDKQLFQGVSRVRQEIQYQNRQNAAMDLLHLAALSLAMVQQLGYEASDLEWLLDTEEEERMHE
ncbi:hypothetical protein [uncultured Selenomonas sp.]|uniref:hypothetical protein n=1 Tax=uncultured Selenomonas sp. TaxID=159275 RepID=UPI0025849642|nr:hypothetical protein [uncultured Selenomonas sp.]